MLKRFASLSKTYLKTLPCRPKRSLRSPLISTPYYRFTTKIGNILSDHTKDMWLMQHLSTKMNTPSKVRKVDNALWDEQGFLTQLPEFSKEMEIYEIGDVPQLADKNTPSGSWVRFVFPLEKNLSIRPAFQRFYNKGIRMGRILELMDYVAATVAYKYYRENPKERKTTMATASVNDMSIFEESIDSSRDLMVTGYVTYVGKTSMEIRIDIAHSEKPKDHLGSAYFMFVARDARDYTKACVLPQLSFEGEEDPDRCTLRQELGREKKDRRIKESQNTVFKTPPSTEEIQELHKLFKAALDPETMKDYVPIQKTMREKLVLMHIQDRNMHGKMFGGFVMKEAVELGWVVAYLNGDGSNPLYVHIDDVSFLRPITIGSMTNFKASVTYIEGDLIHVAVVADNILSNEKEERAFEVHVIYSVEGKPKPVIPVTYFDGMVYLEGKRRINRVRLSSV